MYKEKKERDMSALLLYMSIVGTISEDRAKSIGICNLLDLLRDEQHLYGFVRGFRGDEEFIYFYRKGMSLCGECNRFGVMDTSELGECSLCQSYQIEDGQSSKHATISAVRLHTGSRKYERGDLVELYDLL